MLQLPGYPTGEALDRVGPVDPQSLLERDEFSDQITSLLTLGDSNTITLGEIFISV